MFGTRALDQVRNFEKHRDANTAQQRFPDLCRRGAPRPPPIGRDAAEWYPKKIADIQDIAAESVGR